jgi:hypothetical protein
MSSASGRLSSPRRISLRLYEASRSILDFFLKTFFLILSSPFDDFFDLFGEWFEGRIVNRLRNRFTNSSLLSWMLGIPFLTFAVPVMALFFAPYYRLENLPDSRGGKN